MVWDANSGTNLLILRGHAAWPASAAFSRDGSRIVTAGHDHVARFSKEDLTTFSADMARLTGIEYGGITTL